MPSTLTSKGVDGTKLSATALDVTDATKAATTITNIDDTLK